MYKVSFLKIFTIVAILGALLAPSAYAASAKLWFNPATGDKTVNQNFDVVVSLDTDGASTDGARAIVNYDTNKLEVLDIKNGVYNSYPTKQWASGKITISGISALDGPYYSGSGTLATLTFKAKATGTTSLTFDYTAGSTTDSNVAEHGTNSDILGEVASAEFNLVSASTSGGDGGSDDSGDSGSSSGSGAGSDSGSSSSSSTGTGAPGPDQTTNDLPDSGAREVTLVLAMLALVLLGSGGFLLRRAYHVV